MPHPDALPNHEAAAIPDGKLREYVLNPAHDRGGDKARAFAATFGFRQEHADELAARILAGLAEAASIPRLVDAYGHRFQVDVAVTGPKGSGIVRTGWIIRTGETHPRMTSAVPLKSQRSP